MASRKAKLSLYWLARNKPYWLVILTGLLLGLSFPPSPLNFLIFVAFVPLFILFEKEVIPLKVPEDKIFRPFKSFFIVMWRIVFLQFLWRKETRFGKVFSYRRKTISGNAQLFRYTYAIFLIWNAFCCYWLILTALGAQGLGEAIVNAIAGILAVVLNPALMSVPFQFYSRVRHVFNPVLSAACFIIFWLCFEYLHFNWELSWSWLTLGHALSSTPGWIQYAEFTGVLGISAYILIANLLIYRAYRHIQIHATFNWTSSGIALGWLVFPLLLNFFLLNPEREIFQGNGVVTVRVVQPNIDPYKKYNFYTAEEQVAHFVELIKSKPLDSVDLVILPETCIPRPLNINGVLRDRLMGPLWQIVDTFGVEILLGMEEYKIFPDEKAAPISASPSYTYIGGERKEVYVDQYNAATLLRADRKIKTYQKGKLVPMVERMPFLDFLSGLKSINIDLGTGMGNYGIQDSMTTLQTQDGIDIGVMICYESEYADHARKSIGLGAEMMTVITNDGWWKQSSGYIQHAWLSVLRAVENRRDIPRAANTGRSMFVDAYGNTTHETDWWTEAVIDKTIHLYKGQTFYSKHGDYIGRIACWLTLLICLVAIFLNYRRPKRNPNDANNQSATTDAGPAAENLGNS